jgi:hypothetical protein
MASSDYPGSGGYKHGYMDPRMNSYNYDYPRQPRQPRPNQNVHVDYHKDNRYNYGAYNQPYPRENYLPPRASGMGRGHDMGPHRGYYGGPQMQRPRGYYDQNYNSRGPNQQHAGAYSNRAPNQSRTAHRQQNNSVRAGTGEYLENRRLVGDEISVPKEDLDLATSMEKLKLTDENEEEAKKEPKETELGHSTEQAQDQAQSKLEQSNSSEDKNVKTEKKEEVPQEKSKQSQDTMTITHGKQAYEKSNFFDDLNLDTNEKREQDKIHNKSFQQPRIVPTDLEEQRHVDAETFGSVAEQYRPALNARKVGPHYNRGGKFMNSQYQQPGSYRYSNKMPNNRYYERQQPLYGAGGVRGPKGQQQQQRFQREPTWQPRQ